ncbi:MAG: alpha/beta hydrolase [Alphaproteobacteria bacterium]|nr:alpha/beta hydrolase [Alphaproteobacteria bacterium]
MPLEAQAQWVLDLVKAAGRPTIDSLPVAAARLQFETTAPILDAEPIAMGAIEDRVIPGPAGAIGMRIYTPPGQGRGAVLPGLIFYHGGGWVIGSLESYDRVCRQLAARAGCRVLSIDYRLAPEHRFPAAAEDAIAAMDWIAENAVALALDPARLAVGGDSAGGNLAAVAAQAARRRGAPALVFQLLVYPATDMRRASASHRELAEGYLLTGQLIDWFFGHYLGQDADLTDWRASPGLAPDLSGLPPALVITAGYDPLKDEGRAYAERLSAAGVPCRLSHYEGMIHGFFSMSGALDSAKRAVEESAAALAAAFAR